MKKSKSRNTVSAILGIVGAVLIIISLLVTVLSFAAQKTAESQCREALSLIYSVIPEIENSFPEKRTNGDMPSAEVNGESFSAILEIPSLEKTLPVCSDWNSYRLWRYPAVYYGSVFSDRIIIGASDNAGQLDITRTITEGDIVFLTDMTGKRYSYTVSEIIISKNADSKTLGESGDLIIFTKNTMSLDYTIIRCTVK